MEILRSEYSDWALVVSYRHDPLGFIKNPGRRNFLGGELARWQVPSRLSFSYSAGTGPEMPEPLQFVTLRRIVFGSNRRPRPGPCRAFAWQCLDQEGALLLERLPPTVFLYIAEAMGEPAP